MAGYRLFTWWRLDGKRIDFKIPEGGRCTISNSNAVHFMDADGKAVSTIVLAPGEAFFRWEGGEEAGKTK